MQSLYKNYDMNVDNAYIIRIKDNEISEKLADRCANSCKKVGMNYKLWDAYNGLDYPITPPIHLKDNIIMNMVKLGEHYMTRGEVACFLSHVSLWSKCVQIEKPIVILEHDSIMLKKYNRHELLNSICYLGCYEQAFKNYPMDHLTPPVGSAGPNYLFICRAHAYAIDPTVARNMLTYVLKYGISSSLDTFLRADIFSIYQNGLYAYDLKDENSSSTILNRPKEGRPGLRNDKLLK